MIITGKHLSRRTLLRGFGTAVALPFLDAMAPALAAPARMGKAPVRMAFFCTFGGWVPACFLMNTRPQPVMLGAAALVCACMLTFLSL